MKRYVVEAGKKVVVELEDDMTVIEMSKEGEEKEIRITRKTRKAVEGSEKYANPPIPEGYNHLSGTWNTGFVIERQTDGSQLVWIPVGSLYSKEDFEEILQKRFGITNYQIIDDEGNEWRFYRYLKEWEKRLESLKKYGGFYFSAHEVSRNDGKISSVAGKTPLTGRSIKEAEELASKFEMGSETQSGLPFIPEYAWVFEWLIKTETKNFMEIVYDSTGWGNYSTAFKCKSERLQKLKNIENIYNILTYGRQPGAEKTGSFQGGCTNGIYDLAGNYTEFVIDLNQGKSAFLGGRNFNYGFMMPAANRYPVSSVERESDTTFRVVLYLK